MHIIPSPAWNNHTKCSANMVKGNTPLSIFTSIILTCLSWYMLPIIATPILLSPRPQQSSKHTFFLHQHREDCICEQNNLLFVKNITTMIFDNDTIHPYQIYCSSYSVTYTLPSTNIHLSHTPHHTFLIGRYTKHFLTAESITHPTTSEIACVNTNSRHLSVLSYFSEVHAAPKDVATSQNPRLLGGTQCEATMYLILSMDD